jgi:hypothetical protein
MNQAKNVRSLRSWMSVKGAVVPLAFGLVLTASTAISASAESKSFPDIPACNPGAVVAMDADGDGLTDDFEIAYGTDPSLADTDDDGLTDSDEITCFTSSPWVVDTDDDGLDDYREFVHNGNPGLADTDEDGLLDHDEAWIYYTLLTSSDSDQDGVSDYDEVIHTGTDPIEADTDGDGAPDGAEIDFGSSPLDDQDFPAVQAGPEPESESAVSAEDEVASISGLPSTGTGMATTGTSSATGMLALLTGAGSVLGSIALRRRAVR